MQIETVQKNKEMGTPNPEVAKLIAQARELIYEAIAIEIGDPVEEVKKFFAEVERANKEANKEQKSEQQPTRQHTLFSNIVGNDNFVGICIIVGYQKKGVGIEKAQPIKYLTSRIIEPLGADILATAAMNYKAKEVNTLKVEDAKALPVVEEAVEVTESPQEGKGIPSEEVEATEDKKEDIPF